MKRSPTYYHNRRLLKELANENTEFRPKKKDVEEWFDILNEQIFGNKLEPFPEIRVKKSTWYHAMFYYWTEKEEQDPELEIHNCFKNKKLFVEILAHEMVHYFQHTYYEPVGHGPSFMAWRDNFKLRGLILYKVA